MKAKSAKHAFNTISIFGGSGKTGRELIRVALETGYIVKAGTFSGKVNFSAHERLIVIQCDATNASDVAKLLAGSDAVISVIGHGRSTKPTMQTDAMRVITDQMRRQKLRRILSLTGTGVRIPGDKPTLIDSLANAFIARIDPERISDGISHARLLSSTDLDWTILRVLKLTNGAKGRFRFTPHGPAQPFVSRATVAAALLALLETSDEYRQMPVLSRSLK